MTSFCHIHFCWRTVLLRWAVVLEATASKLCCVEDAMQGRASSMSMMHLHLETRRTSPATSVSASSPESQMQIEGENLLTAASWSFFHSLFKMDICSDSIKCLDPFPAVELCKLHLLYINKGYHRDSVFFFFFFNETPEEISGNIKVLILIGGLWWLMMAKNILFFFLHPLK